MRSLDNCQGADETRETWCTRLWLMNNDGLYHWVEEEAQTALDSAPDYEAPEQESNVLSMLELTLKEKFDGWGADVTDGGPTSQDMSMMLGDIGSLYRVDWRHLAAELLDHFKEDAA